MEVESNMMSQLEQVNQQAPQTEQGVLTTAASVKTPGTTPSKDDNTKPAPVTTDGKKPIKEASKIIYCRR